MCGGMIRAIARIVPCAARHAANRAIAKTVNRHKREVNNFACGTKSRRMPLAALPGADVWRHAWGVGAHCPCTARHAATGNNLQVAVPDQAQLFHRESWHAVRQAVSQSEPINVRLA
jgi:hypothetical protein